MTCDVTQKSDALKMTNARSYIMLSRRQKDNKWVKANVMFLRSKWEGCHGIWRHTLTNTKISYCVKSVRIRGSSGPYSVQKRENTDQNNSEYKHFLRNSYILYHQTSNIERFVKKFVQRCILDVWQSSEYVSGNYMKF